MGESTGRTGRRQTGSRGGRLVASLRSLSELDFDALLLGDGAPILSGGRAALRRLVEALTR